MIVILNYSELGVSTENSDIEKSSIKHDTVIESDRDLGVLKI